MLTLEHEANKYFKLNIHLNMTPEQEVQFQQSTIKWLVEELKNLLVLHWIVMKNSRS